MTGEYDAKQEREILENFIVKNRALITADSEFKRAKVRVQHLREGLHVLNDGEAVLISHAGATISVEVVRVLAPIEDPEDD